MAGEKCDWDVCSRLWSRKFEIQIGTWVKYAMKKDGKTNLHAAGVRLEVDTVLTSINFITPSPTGAWTASTNTSLWSSQLALLLGWVASRIDLESSAGNHRTKKRMGSRETNCRQQARHEEKGRNEDMNLLRMSLFAAASLMLERIKKLLMELSSRHKRPQRSTSQDIDLPVSHRPEYWFLPKHLPQSTSFPSAFCQSRPININIYELIKRRQECAWAS